MQAFQKVKCFGTPQTSKVSGFLQGDSLAHLVWEPWSALKPDWGVFNWVCQIWSGIQTDRRHSTRDHLTQDLTNASDYLTLCFLSWSSTNQRNDKPMWWIKTHKQVSDCTQQSWHSVAHLSITLRLNCTWTRIKKNNFQTDASAHRSNSTRNSVWIAICWRETDRMQHRLVINHRAWAVLLDEWKAEMKEGLSDPDA